MVNTKKRTDAQRQAQAERRRGQTWSEATKKKMAASHKDKTQSQEWVTKRVTAIKAKASQRTPEERTEIGAKIWATRRAKQENA